MKRSLLLSLFVVLAAPCAAQTEKSLPGQPDASIELTKPDGWTIATLPAENAVWSFTPEGHYAHPAVVRRAVKEANGGVYVETNALCQAAKAPCDRLMREFQQLDRQMRDLVQTGRGPGAGG